MSLNQKTGNTELLKGGAGKTLQAEREGQGPLAFAGQLRKAGWGTRVGEMSIDVTSPLVRQRECAHTCACVRVHTLPPRVGTAGAEGAGRRPGAAHRADIGALPQLTAPSAGEVEESASTDPKVAQFTRGGHHLPVCSCHNLWLLSSHSLHLKQRPLPAWAPRCLGWGTGQAELSSHGHGGKKLTAATYPGAPVGHCPPAEPSVPSPRLDAAS